MRALPDHIWRPIRVCGLVTAGFGFISLLGWLLQIPLLASLGPGLIPMAPSTAVLFLLYGVAVILRERRPLDRSVRVFGAAVSSTAGLIALLLLILSILGISPQAETLGLTAVGSIQGAPVGYMSPVTAACFLLASASFLGSLSFPRMRSWAPAAAWWAACLLLGTSCVLLLAYIYGAPLLYGGPLVPPAATTSLAFGALGIALLALSHRSAAPAGAASAPPERIPYWLVLIFVALATSIVGVGGAYLRSSERDYRAEVERELMAVAELKASQLLQWRAERLGDASVFAENPAIASLLRRGAADPQGARERGALRARLGRLMVALRYNQIAVLDAAGIAREAIPADGGPLSSVIASRVPEVLRSGTASIEDLYRNEHDGRVYLSVLVPILGEQSRALGVVALRIDPETYLYPFLSRWPTSAQTAETLLVRRDGDDVLFLNELKFRKDAALTLRVPLARPDLPAGKAVLGSEGIVEGRDYRGVPVIAALQAVAGSPWYVVARMDAAEVMAPMRGRLWEILVLVGGLVGAAAAGAGLIWRTQRAKEFQQRYEEAGKHAWLHEVIARSASEIYAFDPETLRFRFANAGACRNIGYTQGEMAGLTPLDLKPEFTAETFRAMIEPLRGRERPAHRFETIHRRKDGSEYPVVVRLQLLDSPAGAVFLAVITDITERRRAEKEILHLNRVYAVLSDVNQAIVRVRDSQALFTEVCRIVIETGGFKMAWLGLLDADTREVRPVAHAGVMDGYLDKLQIDAGGGPRGLGPTGIAVREGRHVVCNDIEHDPRMAPWREDALALGYRASAAFPLKVNGEIAGAFNLYASEPDFFDEEEMRLLDEMAADLSFSMQVAQTEGARLRLATAIEQSPVLVMITDVAGRIEYVNPAFTRITGYAAEEALGENPRMLKSGKQDLALYEDLWARIKAGRNWHGELVNKRKDGSLYSQDLTIAPVHEATGVTRFVAIGQDVTERKRAEEAIQSSEERYRALFDESPDGVLILDADAGRVIEANPAASKQLGYTRDEFAALRILDFEAGETPEETEAHIQRILASGSDNFETLHRTKNGEIRNVHVWAKRIQLDGRAAFHCIFEDITERERVEATLRQHALELIDSQRIARLGSYRHDLISGTWTSSKILDEIFGIVDPAFPKDLPAWLSIVHPDARKEMADYFAEEVIGKAQPFDREYRIIRLADGEERWVHGLGRLVADREGRLVEMIGTIQDITEHKRAEQALEASVREKGALLKEVHHRVKNNMQVITSLLRLESSRIDHPITRAVLKDMQNRIQSMAVLHETLYRSGNLAEVDLGAYLRQLAGQLVRSMVATPGQIELRLDLASVGLNLDQAIPCGLIVNELLSNSLKHGFPAGRSGEVRVELHRVGDEGLRLRVSDNGIGLPPDFEANRGASLGLQLVSDLARQLNSSLVIHPGSGASLEVTFVRVDTERI